MQAKNRRIERWENDVGELRALLEEQLPRAHDSLHSTGVQMRFLTAWKGTVDANEAGEAGMAYIEETLRSATAAFRDASESVGELMARMQRIEGRIKMRNREAAYWARLASKRITLRVAMFDVERDPSWGGKQLDDAAYDAAWDKVRKRRDDLLETVKPMADQMKPPSVDRRRHARQLITRWGQRVALVYAPAAPDATVARPEIPTQGLADTHEGAIERPGSPRIEGRE